MLIFYDILLALYAIVYFPILVLKGKWHGGFGHRFGFYAKECKEFLNHPKNIWIHAVSVGEVVAMAGLIAQVKTRLPDHRIILSTVTQTGYELASKHLGADVTVIWAPLDFRLTVAGMISIIQPKIYVVAETELWPNL